MRYFLVSFLGMAISVAGVKIPCRTRIFAVFDYDHMEVLDIEKGTRCKVTPPVTIERDPGQIFVGRDLDSKVMICTFNPLDQTLPRSLRCHTISYGLKSRWEDFIYNPEPASFLGRLATFNMYSIEMCALPEDNIMFMFKIRQRVVPYAFSGNVMMRTVGGGSDRTLRLSNVSYASESNVIVQDPYRGCFYFPKRPVRLDFILYFSLQADYLAADLYMDVPYINETISRIVSFHPKPNHKSPTIFLEWIRGSQVVVTTIRPLRGVKELDMTVMNTPPGQDRGSEIISMGDKCYGIFRTDGHYDHFFLNIENRPWGRFNGFTNPMPYPVLHAREYLNIKLAFSLKEDTEVPCSAEESIIPVIGEEVTGPMVAKCSGAATIGNQSGWLFFIYTWSKLN